MGRSGSTDAKLRWTVDRRWFAVVLAVCFASGVAETFMPDAVAPELTNWISTPADLLFPISFSQLLWLMVPPSVGIDVLRVAMPVAAAVGGTIAWLVIRRLVPQRLKLWRFLVILVVWAALSFPVDVVGIAGVSWLTHHI